MSKLPHRRKAYRSGGGATDWTADSTMIALYQFEGTTQTASMGDDSLGTNDAGDNSGGTDYPEAVSGGADYIHGSQSAFMNRSGTDDHCRLTMSNAEADFPANGTGDSDVTVGGWVKVSSGGTRQIFTIGDEKQAMEHTSGFNLVLDVAGESGTSSVTTTSALTSSTWYFVAWVYSDSADLIWVYYREQGEASGSGEFKSAAADIGTLTDQASTYMIMGRGNTTGDGLGDLMDSWGFFNGTAMTEAELDGVFDNGWDGLGWDNA